MCNHENSEVVKEFPNGDKIFMCNECGERYRKSKRELEQLDNKKRWWKVWLS